MNKLTESKEIIKAHLDAMISKLLLEKIQEMNQIMQILNTLR